MERGLFFKKSNLHLGAHEYLYSWPSVQMRRSFLFILHHIMKK